MLSIPDSINKSNGHSTPNKTKAGKIVQKITKPKNILFSTEEM